MRAKASAGRSSKEHRSCDVGDLEKTLTPHASYDDRLFRPPSGLSASVKGSANAAMRRECYFLEMSSWNEHSFRADPRRTAASLSSRLGRILVELMGATPRIIHMRRLSKGTAVICAVVLAHVPLAAQSSIVEPHLAAPTGTFAIGRVTLMCEDKSRLEALDPNH